MIKLLSILGFTQGCYYGAYIHVYASMGFKRVPFVCLAKRQILLFPNSLHLELYNVSR